MALLTVEDYDPDLWLDSSDSDSLTLVSGVASEWNDKSGNSRNYTQTTSTKRPTLVEDARNGLDVLRFDGSDDDLNATNLTLLRNTNALTLFVVAFGDDTQSTTYGAFFGDNQTTDTVAPRVALWWHKDGFVRSGGRVDGGTFVASNTTETLDALICAIYDYGAGQITVGVDGVYLTDTSLASGTMPDTNSGYNKIGHYLDSNYFKGDICEIAAFRRILSVDEREEIEGILAHKWGAEEFLPSEHPYKDAPPTDDIDPIPFNLTTTNITRTSARYNWSYTPPEE